MASSRRTWVERIVAGLAGTSHPGRRKWRKGPPHGRRWAVAGRSFSPSIIRGCFSKRTHMMTPIKIEKRRFPQGKWIFAVQGRANQKGFFTKRTQMIQPRPSVFHRLPQCRRIAHSQWRSQAATALSAPRLWLRLCRQSRDFVTAQKNRILAVGALNTRDSKQSKAGTSERNLCNSPVAAVSDRRMIVEPTRFGGQRPPLQCGQWLLRRLPERVAGQRRRGRRGEASQAA